ncbi:extracellular solute-binding protein [Sneathiella litorea]|uniref:ABC transporter substrate-binding protein n=1 Tax=Sneathiella litorea TaxID=2606216 RepID=A0A6L8W583_9PROT|nr:extracellular solute-binding protein [Sneathiella litorea]MZR29377.1 ABC transporter substrate-binding protein [Sneathiella litorea]
MKTSLAPLFAILLAISPNAYAEPTTSHGLSTFGGLKYGPDFAHFDYVNPDAPKGGTIKIRDLDSFDSVNPFLLKGNPGVVNGDKGGDLYFNFTQLMTPSYDEPDGVYGLLAETVTLDDKGQWVEFMLRPEARFHDGTPITAEDVAFTFLTLKEKGHPRYGMQYRDVIAANVLDKHKIRFEFREGALTRGLPYQIAIMPILSIASFETRDFDITSMEPLLGSGPYQLTKVSPGRTLTYERVKNHWAENLPVHKGRFNFDVIQVDYYRDRTIALEAFFAGEYDFREEFTSRSWATEYENKPAVKSGYIKRDTLKDEKLTGLQAFFMNSRRAPFDNIKARKAFSILFDYEWTNQNLFYGLYDRLGSIFENSDMKATGLPTAAELDLLTPYRDILPAAVFTQEFTPPKTDGSGNIRLQIREALKLFKEAGWTIQDKKLVDATGQQMQVAFLLYEQSFTRIINPYVANLKRTGIDASVRVIDSASWQNRVREFDFDIVVRRFPQSQVPGVEQRDWWGSESANVTGGLNIAGVKNPAVDALIEKLIEAQTRQDLITATRALDRVLMWNYYFIPQWYKSSHFIAYWDKFGRPASKKPGFDRAVLQSWWYDQAKAEELAARRGN